MVACDNTSCSKQWFHFECVGLKRKPRGKWFFPIIVNLAVNSVIVLSITV